MSISDLLNFSRTSDSRPGSEQQANAQAAQWGMLIVASLSLLLTASLVFSEVTFMQELENRTWDWRARRVAHASEADPRIKIIDVDQTSLDFFEREYALTWPLPRDTYKYVLDFLATSGAKGIAFDMLFTESSAQAVESDKIFAAAAGNSLANVMALTLESHEKYLSPEKLATFVQRQSNFNERNKIANRYRSAAFARNFPAATFPIPELLENSSAFGYVQAVPDSDGVFRRHIPIGKFQDVPVLSLPFALYEVTRDTEDLIDLFQYQDSQGRLTIKLHGNRGTYQSYPLSSVIQSQAAVLDGNEPMISPSAFKDSLVILGTTAPGLLDLRPTSLEERGHGVQFVAAVLDNILNQDFIVRFSALETFLLCVLLVMLVLFAKLLSANFRTQAGLLLIISLGYLASIELAAQHNYWVPLVLPGLSFSMMTFLGIILQYQVEGKQYRFVRKAFQHYVSPSLVQQIVANPSRLSLGGERRETTIFFSDIEGFTTASEKLDAAKLVQLLNDYLSLVTEIIQDNAGTVDKFVGDAVVAFWNAPLPIEQHALKAVETAIACQKALQSKRDFFIESFGMFPSTRIGIHTAQVNVGNFGSRTRFNYTVIGDAANLASRLEGVNKLFGTYTLFSEMTRIQIGSAIPYRRIAEVTVLGKSQAMQVYEPLFAETADYFSEARLQQYNQALGDFDAGRLAEAKEGFTQLPDDPVSRAYLKRINVELHLDLPGDFNHVWNLDSK